MVAAVASPPQMSAAAKNDAVKSGNRMRRIIGASQMSGWYFQRASPS
jgi:hypothetical protein